MKCANTCENLEPDFVIFVTSDSDSDSVYYTVFASVHFIYSETSMQVFFSEKLYSRLMEQI
jgi:hypothetical protein